MRSCYSKIVLTSALLLPAVAAEKAEKKVAPSESGWPMYNRDLAGTRFSPLSQVNTKNVEKLSQKWAYRLRGDAATQKAEGGRFVFSEATPIVVQGVLYLPAGNRVLALEPESGAELWRYESKTQISRRGVAYWPGDGANPARILATSGRRLIALNAATGKLDSGFGKEGVVDMVVPYNSAPTVFKNIILVGSDVPDRPAHGPPGDSHAYDARTGEKLWEFHSIPGPGEPGHETWEGESWKNRTGVNIWAVSLTVDEERGIVYLPFSSPASDYYGGDRKGQNLYGSSLVAADAQTGKLKWYFQTTHHDIWNQDVPSAPGLIDVVRNGKKEALLALPTKNGNLFILDRQTGKPVFGVEERPVPKTDVPGEESWPTQPFPLKPPPLARTRYQPEDLVTAADTTAEHAEGCRALVEKSGGINNAGPYTTYLYRAPGAPPKTSVLFPGDFGGTDWGGTAFDPRLGYVFVNTSDAGAIGWIEKKPEGSADLYDRNSVYGPIGSRFEYRIRDESGKPLLDKTWPCQKPPWGRLTAVNAKTGEIAWQVPLGVTDELPEGKKNTGRINLGGPIVTAGGLVFIGATTDHRFRAFDSKTGKQLWEANLEYSAMSVPITYQGKDGKQYVAIVASGNYMTDPRPSNQESLIVFALP